MVKRVPPDSPSGKLLPLVKRVPLDSPPGKLLPQVKPVPLAFPAQVLPVRLPESFLVLAQHLVELALRVSVPALLDLPDREQFLVAQHLAEPAQGVSVRARVVSLVPAALPFPEEFLVHQ